MLMKTLVITLFFSLVGFINYAQTKYHLQVKDNQGKPAANLLVRFVETNTFERIEKKLSPSGTLDYTFDRGELWIGSIGEMNNCIWVETGFEGNANDLITYDLVKWERENRVLPERSSINFKQTKQEIKTVSQPDANHSFLKVVVKSRKGTPQANLPVTLTCFALKEQFIGQSNSLGEALFLVPNKNDYQIDVAEIQDINFFDIGSVSTIASKFISYEKKSFVEKTEGKYTIQTIPTNVEPTISHANVSLTILKNGSLAPNEIVYIKPNKGFIKYKGKTDTQGKVTFMLPLKMKYIVGFTFQRDAAFIDLTRFKGFASVNQTIEYTPDERLMNIESLIPRVKELTQFHIDEFVQAQYPEHQDEVELFLKWGNKFNSSSKEALLEVGFHVKKKMKNTMIPKNFMFVIDISASMSGDDKLELLKNTLIKYIVKMNPTDKIGIIAFDDLVYNVLPSQFATNKTAICDVVRALEPKGGTIISPGIKEGINQLLASKKPNMVNRLILLSDGYGGDAPEESIELVKQLSKSGIQTTAVGVGYGYNEALMKQLATIGGGGFEITGDPSHFDKTFLKLFEGATEPIGKNVKLEILLNDQIVYRQLIGYDNATHSKGLITVDIDYLFPNLQKMALLKLDLIHATPKLEKEKVTARLIYTDFETNKIKTIEKNLLPEWEQATGNLDLTLDMNHKKMLVVAIANQSMKLMAEQYERKDKIGAENAVLQGIEQIKKLFPNAIPEDLNSLFKKLDEYVAVFEEMKTEP